MSPAQFQLTAEIAASGLSRKDWYRTIYLRGSHWKELRGQAIDFYGDTCTKCRIPGPVDVHHLRYRDIFDVGVGDLQILCRGCHDLEHEQEGSGRHAPGGGQTRRKEKKIKKPSPKTRKKQLVNMAKAGKRALKKAGVADGKERMKTVRARTSGISLNSKHLVAIVWTCANTHFFGLKHPLKSGWKKGLIGLFLTDDELAWLMKPIKPKDRQAF